MGSELDSPVGSGFYDLTSLVAGSGAFFALIGLAHSGRRAHNLHVTARGFPAAVGSGTFGLEQALCPAVSAG
jgi:hypothetical protein